jgi:hypothetical protein
MDLVPLRRRAWLNKASHHSTAYVHVDYEGTNLAGRWPDGPIISIADCSRSVSLSFGVGRTEIKNSLFKVRKLQEVLGEVAARLEAAEAYWEENPK